MENKISTLIASDENHDKIFIEIYVDNKFLAIVSQEDGIDNLVVEFPESNLDTNFILRTCRLSVLMDAIHTAMVDIGAVKSS